MDAKIYITEPLKPALASIPNSCKYLGGISRAKFYADILPMLETVHYGARHLVVVASMDRLIASRMAKAGVHANLPGQKHGRGRTPRRSGKKGFTLGAETQPAPPHRRGRPRKNGNATAKQ